MSENAKNSEGMRFAAFQIDGRICLQGGVHDSTSFANLEALLDIPKKVSLKNIRFSTWNGLRRLFDLLTRAKCRTISEVPFAIIEELRIMSGVGDFFEIKSIFYPFQDPNSIEWTPESRLIEADEIMTALLDHGDWFVEAPVHVMALSSTSLPAPDGTRVDFLYDYFTFCVTILSTLVRQLEASEHGLREIFLKTFLRQNGIRSALHLLQGKSAPVANVQPETHVLDSLNTLMRSIDRHIENLRFKKFKIRAYLGVDTDMIDVQKLFLSSIGQLREIVDCKSQMEDSGISIGGFIQEFDESLKYNQILTSLSGAVLGIVDADTIKELLNVMDPLIGDSIDEIIELITSEVAELERDIGSALVILQGFDLARQVLEHRGAEIDLPWVAAAFGPDVDAWNAEKARLFEKMVKKLVTEQETAAFNYFIQRYVTTTTEKSLEAGPGDVMLF
jgi:hypothetical protein